MNTTAFQRSRWIKWSSWSLWESKFNSLERLSNSNLTQSGNKQSQSLNSSATPLRNMLTLSLAWNITSAPRKLCWWLRLRGKPVMTMKMGCICSWFTLSDLSAAFKIRNKRCPKFWKNWKPPFPKYLWSIRQDKAFHRKIHNTKNS